MSVRISLLQTTTFEIELNHMRPHHEDTVVLSLIPQHKQKKRCTPHSAQTLDEMFRSLEHKTFGFWPTMFAHQKVLKMKLTAISPTTLQCTLFLNCITSTACGHNNVAAQPELLLLLLLLLL